MAWAISGRQRAIGLARPVGLRRFQATGLEAVATGLLLRLGDRVASCEHGGEPPERSGGPTFVEPPRLRGRYAPGGWAGFRLPGSARPSPWAQRARLWATSLRGPTPAAPMGATRNQ